MSGTVHWAAGLVGQEHAVRTLDGLLDAAAVGRFVLLYGPRAVGKGTAARQLAAALVSPGERRQRPADRPDPEGHPDAAYLVPDKPGGSIKVDDVRLVAEQAHFPPLKGPHRVWLIDPMEALTAGAANALLRILEEPPKHLWIVGVAHNLSAVVMTLRSRATKIPFQLLGPEHLGPLVDSQRPEVVGAGTVERAQLLGDPGFQRHWAGWQAMCEARRYDPDAPVKFVKGLSSYPGGLAGFWVGVLSQEPPAVAAAAAGQYHGHDGVEAGRAALVADLETRQVLLSALGDLEQNVNPSFVCEEAVRRIRQVRKQAQR